jgi:hypothetical protein
MSTDIVRFQKGDSGKSESVFSLEALRLFLAITLPLMVVSFLAWGVFYYWVTTLREKLRLVNAKARGAEP